MQNIFTRFVVSCVVCCLYTIQARSKDNFWERDTTIVGGTISSISVTNDNRNILALVDGKVYHSSDYGEKWQPIDFPTTVTAISATFSENFVASTKDSIYYSTDQGRKWKTYRAPIRLGTTDRGAERQRITETREIINIGVNHILVFIQTTFGRVDSFRVSVYSTKNLGATWDSVTLLPVTSPRVTYCKEYGIILMAGYNFGKKDNKGGIIMQSVDSGKTWQTLIDTLPSYIGSIIMLNKSTYITTIQGEGLYKSTDTGLTWLPALSPVNTVGGILKHNEMLLLGSREHLYISTDSGRSWNQSNILTNANLYYPLISHDNSVFLNTGTGTFLDIAFPSAFKRIGDNFTPGSATDVEVFGHSTILTSYWGGSSITTDRGTTWRRTELPQFDSRTVGFSSRGTLLISTYDYLDNERTLKLGTKRSTDNGETWHEIHELYDSTLYPIYAQCFLPVGDTIFAGALSGGAQRSTDDGLTWRTSLYQSEGKPPSTFIATVISLCRTRAGTYLAGYTQGMARSTDGGNIYRPALGLPNLTWVPAIIQHPTTGRIFAARTGFCDYGISYSDDDGETWIPHPWWDGCVQRLAADSLGNIYASSSWEIYRSSDNGATWENITSGLPPDNGQSYGLEGSPVSSLVCASDGRLYVGLQDGGLYRSTQRYPPVGVEEQPVGAIQELPLQIIPNPAGEYFTVHFPPRHSLGASGSVALVTVRDVFGRAVLSGAVGERFSTAGLAAGIYILTIRTAGGIVSRAFVKE